MDEAEKAMFAKSVDSVKGLVEACKGIGEPEGLRLQQAFFAACDD